MSQIAPQWLMLNVHSFDPLAPVWCRTEFSVELMLTLERFCRYLSKANLDKIVKHWTVEWEPGYSFESVAHLTITTSGFYFDYYPRSLTRPCFTETVKWNEWLGILHFPQKPILGVWHGDTFYQDGDLFHIIQAQKTPPVESATDQLDSDSNMESKGVAVLTEGRVMYVEAQTDPRACWSCCKSRDIRCWGRARAGTLTCWFHRELEETAQELKRSLKQEED